MHSGRALTIQLVAGWVGISRASRIQTNQLLHTLSHLGDIANSTGEAVSSDFASAADRLHLSHKDPKTFDARLERHASETLQNSFKEGSKEEGNSNVAVPGSPTLAPRASRANRTVVVDENRSHGIKDAPAHLQSTAFLHVFLDGFRKVVGHLFIGKNYKCDGEICGLPKKLEYSGGQLFIFLLLLALAIAVTSSEEKEPRRQKHLHKDRIMYEWEQTASTITFYRMLPEGSKEDEIEVKIGPKHLTVAVHGKKPFINEELYSQVHGTCGPHNISRQGELSICLQKAVQDVEWPCVLQVHNPSNDESEDRRF